ncbi:MAG: hypothetical protein HY904_25660 [Deltaproteobacteria bacterium]|nr:hypothetical protein [Deltaproteobacteria bacterium]
MIRRPPLLAWLLPAALAAWACTRSDLFGVRDEPSLPDKMTLSGTVCSDNPLQRRFPVKVIFLMDASSFGSTATGGVVNQFRTQAVSDILNLYAGAPEISWSIIKYDGETESLTQDQYTRDITLLQQAATRSGLPCTAAGGVVCSKRRWELALERANNLITGDLLVSERGARARTRYVVVLYSEGPRTDPDTSIAPDAGLLGDAGPPNANNYYCDPACVPPPGGFNACTFVPPCDDGCNFEREIRRMRKFVTDNGGGDLVLHTAHFAVTPPAPPGPGGEPCCGTGAPDDQCDAQNALARMAAAGGGTYLQYASIGELSFRAFEYSATRNVLIMKNIVVANLNAKPGTGGFSPDSDADGLSDDEERDIGTQPLRPDTDGDQLGDHLENVLKKRVTTDAGLAWELDPTVPDSPLTCQTLTRVSGRFQDRDGDGLNDCEELLLGTDPTLFDSDSDGYPDRLEMMLGTNYLLNDVNHDTDQDGARNGDELKGHTDPRSNDARTRGDLSYLYKVIVRDDGTGNGLSRMLDVQQPRALSGVVVRFVTPRAYVGVSTIEFDRANTRLRWRDNYGGPDFGAWESVDRRGQYTLQGKDSVQSDALRERSITIEVTPELLPPRDIVETLQVRETERQCVDWRVRNITLVHTAPRGLRDQLSNAVNGDSTQEGLNHLVVYYGQAPLNSPMGASLFRVAQVDVVYVPPRFKDPDVAEIPVLDADFALVGEGAVGP